MPVHPDHRPPQVLATKLVVVFKDWSRRKGKAIDKDSHEVGVVVVIRVRSDLQYQRWAGHQRRRREERFSAIEYNEQCNTEEREYLTKYRHGSRVMVV